MTACPCGKQSYPSASAVYEAIDRQRKRQKASKRSKGRMRRGTTQIDGGHVMAYRCHMGSGFWHMGHGSLHE